jgi:hypothetical protein
MVEQLLDIAKYILPSVVVLIATYLIVNKFLIKEIQQKQLAIFQQNSNLTLQMRLQAYERLSIFIERMHATSLIRTILCTRCFGTRFANCHGTRY